MIWHLAHSGIAPDCLGLLPAFVSGADPRPAAEQIADRYPGGWDNFKGFLINPEDGALDYPGDPTMYPIAMTSLRGEVIRLYEFDWVSILQPDGSFEVSRLS